MRTGRWSSAPCARSSPRRACRRAARWPCSSRISSTPGRWSWRCARWAPRRSSCNRWTPSRRWGCATSRAWSSRSRRPRRCASTSAACPCAPSCCPKRPCARPRPSRRRRGGDDRVPFGGHLVYTSGTTGSYKKLLLAGHNECARNEARAAFYGFRNDTCHHGVELGLWTAMGSKNPPAVWHAGGCVVFDQRPDWPRHFFRRPLTHAGLIPPMVKDLLDSPVHPGRAPPGFQLSVAAGFLPLNVVERVRDDAGHRRSQRVRNDRAERAAVAFDERAACRLLLARAHARARASGSPTRSGASAPWARKASWAWRLTDLDCTGYVDDPEATARFFRDGWFCPGDLAVRREDGRIQLRGRATDVLNVEGQKIAAAPIELAIQRELGVSEVCLFSGLAKDGVEELVLAIESDRTPTTGAARGRGRAMRDVPARAVRGRQGVSPHADRERARRCGPSSGSVWSSGSRRARCLRAPGSRRGAAATPPR